MDRRRRWSSVWSRGSSSRRGRCGCCFDCTPTEPAPAPAPTPATQTSGVQTSALFSPEKNGVVEKPPLFQDPELGNTPLFNGNVSPLVESATLAPIEDSFMSILHPARPSPWAVLLRTGTQMGEMDRSRTGPGEPPAGSTQ